MKCNDQARKNDRNNISGKKERKVNNSFLHHPFQSLHLFEMEGEIQRLRALERAAAKDLAHSNNIVELRKVSMNIFISLRTL